MTNQDQKNEQLKEAMKHREVLLAIQKVLSTKEGKIFVKYLFETFGVLETVPVGMSGDILMEYLGHLRAGNSIFKIVVESSPDLTGQLIAQIEKEKYAEIQFDEIR